MNEPPPETMAHRPPCASRGPSTEVSRRAAEIEAKRAVFYGSDSAEIGWSLGVSVPHFVPHGRDGEGPGPPFAEASMSAAALLSPRKPAAAITRLSKMGTESFLTGRAGRRSLCHHCRRLRPAALTQGDYFSSVSVDEQRMFAKPRLQKSLLNDMTLLGWPCRCV